MPLLSRGEGDQPTVPVFSSMQHATTFLAKGEELGYHVRLDYIFPADGSRLAADFPGHQFRLDPNPESFFNSLSPPAGRGSG